METRRALRHVLFFLLSIYNRCSADIHNICKQTECDSSTKKNVCFVSLICAARLLVVCFVIRTSVRNCCCCCCCRSASFSCFSTVKHAHTLTPTAAASVYSMLRTGRTACMLNSWCGEFAGIWKQN